jgi:cytochrome c
MRISSLALLTLILAAAVDIGWAVDGDDTSHGRALFERRCGGCHALDSNKIGPPLRRSFGQRAGANQKFPYSDALQKARLVWDEATLDRWLTDSESLIPDSDMSFRLERADERTAIIRYLKKLSTEAERRR